MEYLDFEKPIEDLTDKLKAQELGEDNEVDVSQTLNDLNKQITKKEKIYNNLTAWQKVQVSRHPQRPYSLDYINALTKGEFVELHGDRNIKDDSYDWWLGYSW